MLYKLCFYVPESHLEGLKTALFEKGAGRDGSFDLCSWQTQGSGQFRGLSGSHPFIGKEGELTEVSEFRVEMVCQAKYIKAVLAELIKSHPYEEPAYAVHESKTIQDFL